MGKLKFINKLLKTVVSLSMLILFFRGISFGQFVPPKKDRGIFGFALENDVWLKQDDGYTNGINLSWVSPALDENTNSSFLRFLFNLNRKILKFGQEVQEHGQAEERETRWVAFSLFQVMCTPDDLTRADPIPVDRPYAGLLAVNTFLIHNSHRFQDVVGLTTGLVGPHSLAGKAQTWLHETFDWTRPMGWENQLKDEPVLNLWAGRTWKLLQNEDKKDGLKYGLKAGVNARLGNLLTSAGGLLEFGVGRNFRPDLEVCSPAPFFGSLSVGRVEEMSVFAFIRAEGWVVARNLLLEGNTFVSSPGVKINRFLGQVTSGLGYRNAFSAACFYLVLKTKEFHGQSYYDPYVGLTFNLNL